MIPPANHRLKSGFTLVELLVVIGIIFIAVGFAVPAFQTIARSSGVALGGDLMMGQLSLARQTAMARNRPVEVRFYRTTEQGGSGAMEYRAMQLHEVLPDGTYKALGNIGRLPNRIIISATPALSTLLTALDSDTTNYGMPDPLPAMPTLDSYTGVAFRFLPNGGTDLPAFPTSEASFHLTLHSDTEQIENSRPINFATVQIDPINGSVRLFRP